MRTFASFPFTESKTLEGETRASTWVFFLDLLNPTSWPRVRVTGLGRPATWRGTSSVYGTTDPLRGRYVGAITDGATEGASRYMKSAEQGGQGYPWSLFQCKSEATCLSFDVVSRLRRTGPAVSSNSSLWSTVGSRSTRLGWRVST